MVELIEDGDSLRRVLRLVRRGLMWSSVNSKCQCYCLLLGIEIRRRLSNSILISPAGEDQWV